jgi:hypothetical protein
MQKELLAHGSSLWQKWQSQLTTLLSSQSSQIAQLSPGELFELLVLCSKYLELSERTTGQVATEF